MMNLRRLVVVVAVSIALAACGGGPGAATVDRGFAHIDTVADLYRGSDVLLDVTVISGPSYTATDAKADSYPGESSDTPQKVPLLTKYAVYTARVNGTVGKRLGVGVLPNQQTIQIGFNVLNPDISSKDVVNVDELKSAGFPQVADLPAVSTRLLVFATPTALGVQGPGYEVISYVARRGDNYVVHFSPGTLKGASLSASDVDSTTAALQFGRPKR